MQRTTGKSFNLMRGVRILAAAAAVIGTLWTASCTTAPVRNTPAGWLDVLPEGHDIILKADIRRTGPLAESLLALFIPGEDQQKNRQILAGRTETVYAGISLNHGGGTPALDAAALGRYPKSAITGGLKRDPRWVRTEYAVDWWTNLDTLLELAVPEPGLVLVSSGNISGMIDASRGGSGKKRMLREVEEEFKVSDIVLYIPEPGPLLAEKLPIDSKRFPISSLWFSAIRTEEEFSIYGVFSVTDEKNARKLAAVAKLLLIGWLRANQLLDISALKETLTVEASGSYVRVSGFSLNDEEMLRMILSFTGGED